MIDNDSINENELIGKDFKDVIIIGNGNVAIDIARIFLKDPTDLSSTDMPLSVIDKLRESQFRSIQVVGRRGLLEAAFTLKEIRELTKIKNKIPIYVMKNEINESLFYNA